MLHIDASLSKISGYATVKLHLHSPLLYPSFVHFVRPSLTSEAGIRYYLGKSLAVECASSLFSSVAYNVRTCSRDRIIYDCLLLDTMLLTSDKSHSLRSYTYDKWCIVRQTELLVRTFVKIGIVDECRKIYRPTAVDETSRRTRHRFAQTDVHKSRFLVTRQALIFVRR